jgi:GntR family transcriptional regulator, transcriptional repressor for pyruvate dehydrogenase complex
VVTTSPVGIRQLRIPKAAELIAEHLRRQIVRHELSEDEELPSEAELMAKFDVSRPTLREAYRILESEGLITVRRGARGGARVHMPRADVAARYAASVLQANGVLLSDVYEARSIIEAPAAAILAERRSAEDIATLRKVYAEADAIEGDPVEYLEAHHRFHNAVSDLAGNQTIALLARMIDAIIDAADFQLVKSRLADEGEIRAAHRAQRTHAKFIDLLESGDAAGAEQLWHKHLSEAGRHVTSAGLARTTLDVMG